MTFQISTAGPDTDWEAIHALLTRAFAFMEGRIDPPSSLTRMAADCLARKAEAETVLLATNPGLIGCLFAKPEGDALYLGKIAIDPDHQGQGVGRALVAAAEDLAQQNGQTALVLETRIELVENHTAFAHFGFVKTAETAHPGYDRPTSITMRKVL
ncbi:MAG: GNAT family N-acetyltransferase [Pseudomonadota bacterium]